ncbi:MAG: hypothetical protein DLM69_04250 [Candidatus Chloroheliales bacterium]|nr:MAG: hypothetical protein DLM69_04250 [Chloroflexota bacterium]
MSDSIGGDRIGSLLARLEQVRQEAGDKTLVPTDQYLRFQVGEVHYALPVTEVRGVDRLYPLAYVPGAPDFVLGVCNRRGMVLPCISLSELLDGAATKIIRSSRLVLIQDHEASGLIGLLADRLLDVVNIGSESIAPAMATLAQGALLRGQTSLANDQVVLLIEPEQLLQRINERMAGR